MTKRRLIKKIKDISDDTLEKEVFFQPGFEPEKIISGIKPEQQEKEMATLRERLAYYQKKETAFKKLQEENEQLKNQQETEKQALEEKNQSLLETLNQKEHEIFELEEQLRLFQKIPAGHYFVLGDNRTHSSDSRMFGFVEIQAIEGIVVFKMAPFKEIGKVK